MEIKVSSLYKFAIITLNNILILNECLKKRKVNLLLRNGLSAGLLVYIFQNNFSIKQLNFLGACRKQKRIIQNSSKNLDMKLFFFLLKFTCRNRNLK